MPMLPNATHPTRRQPEAHVPFGLHPASIILLWLCMAIALQALHIIPLLTVGGLVLALAGILTASPLYALLRRTRWIMLSLLLIYAFATPGEPLWEGAGHFSPTLEGLSEGGWQLLRLVSALAALSIALSVLPRRQLIGGIHTLTWPLGMLGLSRERLAVRLALTLDYAESAMQQTAADWRAGIEHLHDPGQPGEQTLEIPVRALRLPDVGLILLGAMLLAPVLW